MRDILLSKKEWRRRRVTPLWVEARQAASACVGRSPVKVLEKFVTKLGEAHRQQDILDLERMTLADALMWIEAEEAIKVVMSA